LFTTGENQLLAKNKTWIFQSQNLILIVMYVAVFLFEKYLLTPPNQKDKKGARR
jgi:hypothetical protein